MLYPVEPCSHHVSIERQRQAASVGVIFGKRDRDDSNAWVDTLNAYAIGLGSDYASNRCRMGETSYDPGQVVGTVCVVASKAYTVAASGTLPLWVFCVYPFDNVQIFVSPNSGIQYVDNRSAV